MGIGDWANAMINFLIGLILGWAANGLVSLVTTAFWPLAILIPTLFLGVLLFDSWFSSVVDKIFPSGVKPAKRPVRRPLARRLGLPLGLAIGLVVAWLGLGLPFVGST